MINKMQKLKQWWKANYDPTTRTMSKMVWVMGMYTSIIGIVLTFSAGFMNGWLLIAELVSIWLFIGMLQWTSQVLVSLTYTEKRCMEFMNNYQVERINKSQDFLHHADLQQEPGETRGDTDSDVKESN